MGTIHDRAKGDIRDLYAYYRFQDHEMTNITLKNTTLSKSDVWFEGHMNWTFNSCTFVKSFYFGVAGDRLEEDTRGTTENEEPFPPYGSNGLNFTDCTMTKPFEVKDNCVAMFVRCTFTDTLTIEDNCKAEFIECTFTKGITLKTYCDIRFIRCSLGMTDFGMDIEGHCKVEIHNCTHGSVDDYWFSISEGCQLLLRSAEGTTLASKYNTIEADDYSEVKMYGYTYVVSEKKDVVTLTANSKFDAFNVPQFSAEKGIVFNLTDSFLFLKDCATCTCGATGQVIEATNSEIRVKDTNTWSSAMNDCIHLSSSKMFLDTFNVIHSDSGRGIVLLEGSEAIFDTGETIDSGQNMAIVLESGSVGTFKSVTLIQSGQSTAIYLLTNSWIKLYNVVTVLAQVTAIHASDSRVTDDTGDLRQGVVSGIVGDVSLMEFSNINEVIGVEESAIVLTDCTYDFRYVIRIVGKKSGFKAQRCKGVLHNTDKVIAELEAACILADCTGPTEWDQVNDIEGELDSALKVTGNLEVRIHGIINIISEQGVALLWEQTGGNAWVSNVQKIESLEESAAYITTAGSFRMEDVQLITSEQKLACNITVTSGEAHFERIASVKSEQADAMNIAVSDGALLRYNGFTSITSDQGNALKGTCSGTGVFANGDTITTQMGLGVAITGSGAQSRFKLADIQSISSQQPPDDMCEISGVSFVQVHRVASFSAETSGRYVLYLRGAGEHIGRAEIIDCPSITGNEVRGGLYVQRFGWTEVICSQEPGAISIQKAAALACGITHTSGRMANYSEIKDSGEDGRGLYVYGFGTSKNVFRFENIDLIEGGISGVDFANDGQIELHNIKEIKTTQGDQGLVCHGDGTLTVTGGSQNTVISAKENSSKVIEIVNQVATFIRVETEVGKGSIQVDNSSKTTFINSKLTGTLKIDTSVVEFYNTETTSGYDVNDSAVNWKLCDVKVGQDDGETKTFDATESALTMMNCTLGGSENITLADTDTIMQHVAGGSFSGEATFTHGGNLLLGTDLSGASKTSFSSLTGSVILRSDFKEMFLQGGVLTAGCGMDDIVISQGAHLSMKDRFDALDVGDDCGFIGNGSYLTTTLDSGTDVGILLNRTFVTGTLTIGDQNGFLGNWIESASGIASTGEDTGFIGNRMLIQESIVVDGSSAFLANRLELTEGDVTGSAGSGIILNYADLLAGDVLPTGAGSGFLGAAVVCDGFDIGTGASSIVAGLNNDANMDTSGSAIFVGANNLAEGTGQALDISAADKMTTYMASLDGRANLRTGLFMDSRFVHMFNQYGSNGYLGDGTALIMGVKGGGNDTAPNLTYDPKGQLRTGNYIYDVSSVEIHHNLPGIIE